MWLCLCVLHSVHDIVESDWQFAGRWGCHMQRHGEEVIFVIMYMYMLPHNIQGVSQSRKIVYKLTASS